MEFEFADVKPNVHNLLIVTVMAIIGIALAKYAANKWPVAGLTDIINSV